MLHDNGWPKQGNFISEMEFAIFKRVFWNENLSIVKLMIFVINGVS